MKQQLSEVQKELFAAVEQKQRENPKLQYGEALKLVARERPDLDAQYTRLSRQKVIGRG